MGHAQSWAHPISFRPSWPGNSRKSIFSKKCPNTVFGEPNVQSNGNFGRNYKWFLAGNQLHELQTHRRRRRMMMSKKNHCNFRPLTVTFEPRHENKSCSACRERVNERVKVVKVVKVAKVVKVKECESDF